MLGSAGAGVDLAQLKEKCIDHILRNRPSDDFNKLTSLNTEHGIDIQNCRLKSDIHCSGHLRHQATGLLV